MVKQRRNRRTKKWVSAYQNYLNLPRKERKAYECAMAEERTTNSRWAVIISSIACAVASLSLLFNIVIELIIRVLGWF